MKNLPEGNFFYDSETLTDIPEKFFVGEIIREKILSLYHEEIPYSVIVGITEFNERKENEQSGAREAERQQIKRLHFTECIFLHQERGAPDEGHHQQGRASEDVVPALVFFHHADFLSSETAARAAGGQSPPGCLTAFSCSAKLRAASNA